MKTGVDTKWVCFNGEKCRRGFFFFFGLFCPHRAQLTPPLLLELEEMLRGLESLWGT